MLTMLQPWMLSRMACYSASVPTPETADAFAKLVEARARLNEVTKQLNEAHISMLAALTRGSDIWTCRKRGSLHSKSLRQRPLN